MENGTHLLEWSRLKPPLLEWSRLKPPLLEWSLKTRMVPKLN